MESQPADSVRGVAFDVSQRLIALQAPEFDAAALVAGGQVDAVWRLGQCGLRVERYTRHLAQVAYK